MCDSGNGIVLFSRHTFLPQRFAVLQRVCELSGQSGAAIGFKEAPISPVYAPEGRLPDSYCGATGGRLKKILLDPDLLDPRSGWPVVRDYLCELRPRAVWVNEEPVSKWAGCFLRWAWMHPTVKIVATGAENIFDRRSLRKRALVLWRRTYYWKRWTGILVCASLTADAYRLEGVPHSVPIEIAFLPHIDLTHVPTYHQTLFDRNHLGWDQNTVVVGFAGYITYQKGWRVLLASALRLESRFKFVLAGTGPERAELELFLSVPELKDRFLFLGYVPRERMPSFYRSLDVFVLPSLTTPDVAEQFGSVLAEAMACRVPVIGSSSGAIPEVIGDAGLIVPENDPDELAQAIKILGDDPNLRKNLAEKGRKKFLKEFTVDAYARRILNILRIHKRK